MLTGPMTNRRSNARNAYDLMSDVQKYILEEPKRIFMGEWLIVGHENIKDALEKDGPECGTVGCIAGNVVLLTGQANTQRSTYSKAIEVLGGRNNVNLEDALYDLFHTFDIDANYGTKKYAQIVAVRIREFQYRHENDLRAVKVTPVKPSTKEKRK